MSVLAGLLLVGVLVAPAAFASATVPAAPAGLTLLPGNAVVNLSWGVPSSDGGSPITGYQVWRGLSMGTETLYATLGTTTSYADTAVTNGVKYFYRIASRNAVGASALGPEGWATPVAPTTVPSAPTLSGVGMSSSISLSWTVPSNGNSAIMGYKVYRGTASGTEGLLAATNASTTTYADAAVTAGVTYYYEVVAVNGVGTSAPSNEVHSALSAGTTTTTAPTTTTTTTTVPPTTTTTTTVPRTTTTTTTTVPLTTTTTTSTTTTTTVPRTTTTTTTTTTVPPTTTTTTTTTVPKTTTTTTVPKTTTTTTTTVPPALPNAPTITQCTTARSGVTVQWTVPSDAGPPVSSYAVYRGTSAGTEQLYALVPATSTALLDTNVARKTRYFYRVAAISSAGTGALSNEVAVTTH